MRIAQLANFYAPTSGGLRTVVDRLRVGYAAAGHDTALVIPDRRPGREITGAGTVFRVPGVAVGAPYRVIVRRRHVLAALEEFAPDRIEVSDKLTLGWVGVWARQRGIGSVLISHERIDAILAPRVPCGFPLTALADRRNATLARRFDHVVTASAFARAEFDRIGALNVRTLPLGVDLERFRPDPGWAPDPAGAIRIVTVGRLSSEKRPDVAIEVLRVLRSAGIAAHLTIVGDGPMRELLTRRAAGLPVVFTGHVTDRGQLAALFGAADVCLAPCEADTFGVAVLEAMACGVPAVVPTIGGPAEIVRGGGGRVVDSDVLSLARGVVDIASAATASTESTRSQRLAARRRAEDFPWTRFLDAMLVLHGDTAETDLRAA